MSPGQVSAANPLLQTCNKRSRKRPSHSLRIEADATKGKPSPLLPIGDIRKIQQTILPAFQKRRSCLLNASTSCLRANSVSSSTTYGR
ncbi:hypothetical protein CONPUDRAFT_139654 [Coniophora puteana RWD-64-598 SS2]|uniref:Uncharacterized protein n=1 Tax=Coniophora puteana (strain RWD-64-598) TaxID=741705 RepID=A0A5M3MAZ4_CONPW|nr:uncharacterized protein CONPUDRAFT_139654 [Coniophora puteana RWD-64-598 SS2]EIW76227.1 hypothetical protein CONPUDRAFT_139654 [Coniophora puteana RWD-64-598 SS2]